MLYKKKLKLRFDKIVDATNIDGKKNQYVFEVTKRIEKELSKFPEFIGVFPFGSRVKGYGSEDIIETKTGMKGSDYDVYILADNALSWGAEDLYEHSAIIGNEYRKLGIKIEFIIQYINIRNLDGLLEMLDIVGPEYLSLVSFSNLLRPGRGKKIKAWRNVVKEELLKMTKEKREKLLRLFSDSLVFADKRSLLKITERIPDFDKNDWLQSRRKLWTKRVCKIFDTIYN